MASPTQFRHYLIAQDAQGNNVEVVRAAEQVGVLAFDTQRVGFVHLHVLTEPLKSRRSYDDRARKFKQRGHPLVARVVDSGEDEGSGFYVTQNVDGETLASYLGRYETLPVWLAMRLTALSLEAVRAVLEVGDFLPLTLLEALRVVQTGPQSLRVVAADVRLADAPGSKSAKARLARSSFEKQEQFLGVFFLERLQTGPTIQEAALSGADFTELLGNLLNSCGPGLEEGIDSFLKTLAKKTPEPPPGELAAPLKPRPLLAPFLASFADVARSVSAQVRIQSQKLDAAQPYAMRGTMTKTGQPVFVEQVPPERVAGKVAADALRQVLNLPKAGKFPNLVPVLMVEQSEGLLCMSEAAVEGIALSELLAVRGTLDPQESYLVLAGMDAALAQLEKADLGQRRLRLEDIFLFTGFGSGVPQDAGLLEKKLNEWPGFSIVLRAHPCLHAMSGRGTDPAWLLPLDSKAKAGSEVWSGAWMAALGCFIAGLPGGVAEQNVTGLREVDALYRMMEDELARGRKGTPSTRQEFLARHARLLQHHDAALPAPQEKGFWAELSAENGAPKPKADEPVPARQEKAVPQQPAALLAPMAPVAPPTDAPSIGFAEALIAQTRGAAAHHGDGLRAMRSGARMHVEDVESSWRPMHSEQPLWLRVLMLAGGSLALGAALAHLSGRAMWQEPVPVGVLVEEPAPAKVSSEFEIELPVASTKATALKPGAPALPPPKDSVLAAVNVDPVGVPATPRPAPAALEDPALPARLQELRVTNDRLPADLRAATEKAARAGNTEAMLAMGRAHLRGEIGPVDERTAFEWFGKAHAAGDMHAAVPLAECHLQGWGTTMDAPRAVELLNQAAAGGDTTAKDLLGVCYARGIGAPRDDVKAFLLCSEAYTGGVASACGNLGALYLRGQGVAQDVGRAVQLFAEGSRRGHADSMLLYAQALEHGSGVTADRTQATQWYQQSARLGNAEAANWCRQNSVSF